MLRVQLCSLQLRTSQDGFLHRNRSFFSSFVLNPRHWSSIHDHQAPFFKKNGLIVLTCILLWVWFSLAGYARLSQRKDTPLAQQGETGWNRSHTLHSSSQHEIALGLCLLFLRTSWSRGIVSLINRTIQPVCQQIAHCNSTQEGKPPTLKACSPDFDSSCCTCSTFKVKSWSLE